MFSFFKKPEPRVLGIDIGSSAVKIVELSKKNNKATLETYGALALGPYANTEIGRATQLPPEKIAEALADLMREAKAISTSAGLAIPISSTLMSLISLPAVEDKDLETMIPLEARKYIPVPISEVTLDWSVIPRDENDFVRGVPEEIVGPTEKKIQTRDVLIVAIHNDALSRHETIAKKAGLKTSFFEVELFSTMRSIAPEETGEIMVIDIGAAVTKLFVISRGILRNSHSITRGSQDITFAISKTLNISVEQAEILKRKQGLLPAENGARISEATTLVLENIFTEAVQAIANWQRQHRKIIGKVYLVGGGAALKGLIDFARVQLKTDVFLGDPFSKVDTPAFLEHILKGSGPEFAVAVGVALRKLQEI